MEININVCAVPADFPYIDIEPYVEKIVACPSDDPRMLSLLGIGDMETSAEIKQEAIRVLKYLCKTGDDDAPAFGWQFFRLGDQLLVTTGGDSDLMGYPPTDIYFGVLFLQELEVFEDD